MPQVKLKVTRWLRESLGVEATGPEEISISVPEGELILGVLRRLTAEDSVFRKIIVDNQGQEFLANVLVILNGCIVDPYDRSQSLLKEGDELMFLPTFDGG